MEPTKTMAEFIINTHYEDIPLAAIENARGRILDCIGCALAATGEESAKTIKQFVADSGGNSQATVIKSLQKTSMTTAAFANGQLMHALDFDDNSMPAMAHTTTCVLPAALAVGEYLHSSGKEIITAYTIGHEVFNKVASCVTTECWYKGFHGTGLFGAFGAVAAAGHLMKLSMEEMIYALGIAASSFTGIKQNMGSMTKSYHAGRAAESGVRACILAKNGYTSNPIAFEGPHGYVKVFSSQPIYQHMEDLGKVWELTERPPYVKPHPSCGGTHAAMNALYQLIHENDISAEEVELVDVGANAGVPGQLLYDNPENTLQAKFSMQFCLSLLLRYKRWGLLLHTQEMVDSSEIKSLYPKIKVHIDEELSKRLAPEFADKTSIVKVEMKDGTIYQREADCPDFSYDMIKEKFWETSSLGMSKERAERVELLVRKLEDESDIGSLMEELI